MVLKFYHMQLLNKLLVLYTLHSNYLYHQHYLHEMLALELIAVYLHELIFCFISSVITFFVVLLAILLLQLRVLLEMEHLQLFTCDKVKGLFLVGT